MTSCGVRLRACVRIRQEKMRAEVLDTMIDVAEELFGTKQ